MSRAERNLLFPEHKKAEELNIRRLKGAVRLLSLVLSSGHLIDSHLHYPDVTPSDLVIVSIQNILKAIEIEET